MSRQRPELFTLAHNFFCGVKRTMSPLTALELINSGFDPAKRPDNYVEDTSEGWMQDSSLFLKINHLIVSGPAGTGKDILVEAFCHAFNGPHHQQRIFSQNQRLKKALQKTKILIKIFLEI